MTAKDRLDDRYRSNRKLNSADGGLGLSYRDPRPDWLIKADKARKLDQQAKAEHDSVTVAFKCPLCGTVRETKEKMNLHFKWKHVD